MTAIITFYFSALTHCLGATEGIQAINVQHFQIPKFVQFFTAH